MWVWESQSLTEFTTLVKIKSYRHLLLMCLPVMCLCKYSFCMTDWLSLINAGFQIKYSMIR